MAESESIDGFCLQLKVFQDWCALLGHAIENTIDAYFLGAWCFGFLAALEPGSPAILK